MGRKGMTWRRWRPERPLAVLKLTGGVGGSEFFQEFDEDLTILLANRVRRATSAVLIQPGMIGCGINGMIFSLLSHLAQFLHVPASLDRGNSCN